MTQKPRKSRTPLTDALRDIAAGRHAVGCECLREFSEEKSRWTADNGCLTIARAALAGEPYSVEEEK